MIRILLILINMFKQQENQPVRLEKKEPNDIDSFCNRIAPYLILLFSTILIILLLIAFVRYGASWFGTEANRYYYGGLS